MNHSDPSNRPNVVFVFADQWRAQATGYAGDPNVRTPHLDELAGQAIQFTTAVASCPVCSPYRASLLTGQHPLTHGVFVNDVHLGDGATGLAQAFGAGGYDTGYVGKWHLDGRGRTAFIPRRARQGFDFWRVCECTHDYNASVCHGDGDRRLVWPGYDAEAQTDAAIDYIVGAGRDRRKPFLLMLSWGPPHNPYDAAPRRFGDLYDPADLTLRSNVPPAAAPAARKDLAGYYAHCSALDECLGRLRTAIRRASSDSRRGEGANGPPRDTIFVFTSDHGDMLGSHGQRRKQRPWDESILVPCLLTGPERLLGRPRIVSAPFDVADWMPTLLGLCGLTVPPSVEGHSFAPLLRGETDRPPADAALIACYHPFAEFAPPTGREFRWLRTERCTYARDLDGPWLLFDNHADPFQQTNLVDRAEHAELQKVLDRQLTAALEARDDRFCPGVEYMRQWGYPMGPDGAVPYGP